MDGMIRKSLREKGAFSIWIQCPCTNHAEIERKLFLLFEIASRLRTSVRRSAGSPPESSFADALERAPEFNIPLSTDKFRRSCREKNSVSPLLIWSYLRPHQMPNVMVDFRFCKGWWHRNGDVYYVHKHALLHWLWTPITSVRSTSSLAVRAETEDRSQ
jgi:hypothetical protein